MAGSVTPQPESARDLLRGQNYRQISRVSGLSVSVVSKAANGTTAKPKPFTVECIKGALERIKRDPMAGYRKRGRPLKELDE